MRVNPVVLALIGLVCLSASAAASCVTPPDPSRSGSIVVWDLEMEQLVREVPAPIHGLGGDCASTSVVALSLRYLAFTGRGTLWAVDLESDEEPVVLASGPFGPMSIVGDRLVALRWEADPADEASGGYRIDRFDLATGERAQLPVLVPVSGPLLPLVAADGRVIWIDPHDDSLWVYDALREEWLLEAHALDLEDPWLVGASGEWVVVLSSALHAFRLSSVEDHVVLPNHRFGLPILIQDADVLASLDDAWVRMNIMTGETVISYAAPPLGLLERGAWAGSLVTLARQTGGPDAAPESPQEAADPAQEETSAPGLLLLIAAVGIGLARRGHAAK